MKYGESLPAGFNVPSSAFWIQKDLTVDGNPFKLVELQPGDSVMDCGGFIGTFTAACMEQGAASVVVYEAAAKNAALLRGNVARYHPRVVVVEAALTAGDDNTVTLAMANFSGSNSIVPGAKGKATTVRATNFRAELLTLKPQVVKLDIEGAEYDLLDSLKPGDLASVRTLVVEFHPIDDREHRIKRIAAFLEAEGYAIFSMRKRAFVASRDKPASLFD